MPTNSEVLCLRNGKNKQNSFLVLVVLATFIFLVIHCIKMCWLVAIVNLKRKKSTQLCLSWNENARGNVTTKVELVEIYSCASFSYALYCCLREERQLGSQH